MPTRPEGAAAGHLAITGRTGVRRKRERGTHERAVVDAILDEGLLCHVGVDDDGPVVTPMAYARVGDRLYLHGAPANRTLRLLAAGAPACITVTLLDGLVLARSAFHHSMNYRCVMLFGTGRPVTQDEEKLVASEALLEHMARGRSADARLPNDSELRSTLVVSFPIEEGSAKVRTGGPVDDDEDLDSPIWAGVVPFTLVAGAPVADRGLPAGTPTPPYARRYPVRGEGGAPSAGPPPALTVARRIFVDPAPLRDSRDFRLLFIGQLVSTFGSQLTVVAIPFQVYSQTHSSFQVGAMSLAQLLPLVIGCLVGGSVGDAVDRRQLLIVSSAALTLSSGALALNALSSHPSLVALYLISALAAGLNGFSTPARNSVVPRLVGQENLVAALSFIQALFQFGSVAGPALAGLLIGRAGIPWVYGIDALTFVVAIGVTALMRPIPPVPGTAPPGFGSIVEGIRYLKGRRVMQGAYLIDVNAMVFGMPRALFPAIGLSILHGGPTVVGYLYAAPGAGALVGALTTGWVSGVDRRGRAVIVAVIVWGLAVTAFGFSHILWLALILLAVAGWADVISAVLRNTILQTLVPEEFRNRIVSIQLAVVQGGPRVGDIESGGVATLAGVQFSVVSGGVMCVLGALGLAAAMPAFTRHRASDIEPTGEAGDPYAVGPITEDGLAEA